MSLFGSATSGVDPQTGSYLSAEQRIGMFKNATGRGGYSGRSSGENNNVASKSSIVVVNKLSEISKKLQNNFVSATEDVVQRVEENRRSISDIYEFIKTEQDQKLKVEKKETKESKLNFQKMRMRLRESLIEGISKITAGASELGRKIGDSAAKPVLGFLEKLKEALMAIGGAWLIQNLPTIIDKLEEIFNDFGSFQETIKKELLNQRGWASGVEYFLRRLATRLKGLGKLGVSAARYIKNALGRITSKVFGTISTFVKGVFESIFEKLKNLFGGLVKRAKDLIPNKIGNLGKSIANSPIGRGIGGVINFGKGVAGDVIRGDFGAAANRITQPLKDLGRSLSNRVFGAAEAPLTKFKGEKGIKTLSNSARESGLVKVLQPITRLLGVPANVVKKMAAPILKRIPVVGILVDIALNKAGGLDWINSIVNGIVTGIGGFTGAWAGAKLGGGIGLVAGGPPGSAIGAVLGGLVGSMFGAQIAEAKITPAVRGSLGMDPEVTSPETGTIISNLGIDTNLNFDGKETPKVDLNLPNRFEGTESTLSGMTLSEDFGSSVDVDITELPPITTKLRAETPTQPQHVPSPPALSATDDEMDQYRSLALKEYQLAF